MRDALPAFQFARLEDMPLRPRSATGRRGSARFLPSTSAKQLRRRRALEQDRPVVVLAHGRLRQLRSHSPPAPDAARRISGSLGRRGGIVGVEDHGVVQRHAVGGLRDCAHPHVS